MLARVSVRDGDTVKHYRIRQLDEGGFFIARRTTFRTLQELVEHYSREADGLCVNLRSPCVQVCTTKIQKNKKNIYSNLIIINKNRISFLVIYFLTAIGYCFPFDLKHVEY